TQIHSDHTEVTMSSSARHAKSRQRERKGERSESFYRYTHRHRTARPGLGRKGKSQFKMAIQSRSSSAAYHVRFSYLTYTSRANWRETSSATSDLTVSAFSSSSPV
ncbi:hypothetical protein BC827DRAFT_1247726, partial [Russula dissimulans]